MYNIIFQRTFLNVSGVLWHYCELTSIVNCFLLSLKAKSFISGTSHDKQFRWGNWRTCRRPEQTQKTFTANHIMV